MSPPAAEGNNIDGILDDGLLNPDSVDTYSHIEQIRELRQRLSETLKQWPEYDTIYALERWLQNQHYDIETTVPQVKSALNTIACLGGFDRHYEKLDEVCQVINSMMPTAVYFPGGIMGFDKNGNVVSVQPVGRARPKSLMQTGRVSDLYRISILECEGIMQVLRKEELRRHRKLGVIMIFDMADYDTAMITMSSVKIYLNNLMYISELFPDSISKVYVINAPAAVSMIIQMAKHFIPQRTFQKVYFLDHDWKHFLREELGDEFLLPYWGGSKAAECPTGSIRMGGDIPEAIKNKAIKSIERKAESELTTIRVGARDEVTIPVQIDAPGSSLSWYFNIDSGDIDFSISFNGCLVWPVFRISTEFVPEYGEINCKNTGVYNLHMNNHHSIFRAKTISYNIEVNNDRRGVNLEDELD